MVVTFGETQHIVRGAPDLEKKTSTPRIYGGRSLDAQCSTLPFLDPKPSAHPFRHTGHARFGVFSWPHHAPKPLVTRDLTLYLNELVGRLRYTWRSWRE